MEPEPLVYASDRTAWRDWLAANRRSARQAWLVYYKKASGRARVPYGDAVSEALCFGWIDSTIRSLDHDRFAQRFTPRRPGSAYSQPNRERLRRLVARGLVAPDVLPSVEAVLAEPFEEPADVLATLRQDAGGWVFFQATPPEYQRIRLAFVADARDLPAEFGKRLRHLRRMNAAGKHFGHGIEEFY
jgi:hypothetical protein